MHRSLLALGRRRKSYGTRLLVSGKSESCSCSWSWSWLWSNSTSRPRSFVSLSTPRSMGQSMYAWGTSVHGSIPIKEEKASSFFFSQPDDDDNKSNKKDNTEKKKPVYSTPTKVAMNSVFGHLFDSTNTLENQQHPPQQKPKISELVCGQDTSAVLWDDGTCAVWGDNGHGQLGVGHTRPVLSPQRLTATGSSSSSFPSLSLKSRVSALVDDGGLYTFGRNASPCSALGHGYDDAVTAIHQPTLVTSLLEDGCTVAQAVVGESHITVLTTEGEVLTAGSGSYGRLGNLDSSDQHYLEPVELLASEGVIALTGGHNFTCALTADGTVFSWGRNDKGQLGDGGGLMVDMYAMDSLPGRVEGPLEGERVVSVAAGYAHCIALTERGHPFFWGMGLAYEPILLQDFLDNTQSGGGERAFVAAACGKDFSILLTDDGKLFPLGNGGRTGVLGHGDGKRDRNVTFNDPRPLRGALEGKKVTHIGAGYTHCLAVVEDDGDDHDNDA